VSNDTDTFVQEVNEGLRQDRMLVLIKRFGPFFLASFAVLFAGMLGWQAWRDNARVEAGKQASSLAAAQQLLDQQDAAKAKQELAALTGAGPRVIRAMARMQRAAALVDEGDLEAALAEFDAAAEAAPDQITRESAQIRAAYVAADIKDFAELRRRLQPLISSSSRFSFLAKELLGVEAWEAGEVDLARDTLQELTLAFDAPQAVRSRAQAALSVVGPAAETSEEGAPAPDSSEGESK
jgi:hypothetical protein